MPTSDASRTFGSDFKRFFLRGLVVLLPSVLTLWIVVKAYQFVNNTIAEPINGWVRIGLVQLAARWEPLQAQFDPDEDAIESEYRARLALGNRNPRRNKIVADLRAAAVSRWWAERWYLDVIGLMVAIVIVYIAGRLLGGFFGRTLYRRLERFITALPVFKQVYPHVKQVVDFLFSDERPLKFNRVVVVEYPRKGVWSVGFLTGDTMKSISTKSGDAVTVFIPSSPTPFTGYTVTVPRAEAIEIPISVEEAIRFAVTGGVLVPEHQLMTRPAEEGGKPRAAEVPQALPVAAETGASRHDQDDKGQG